MGIRGRSDGNIADAEIQNGKMLYPPTYRHGTARSVMTSADAVEPNRGARGSARNDDGNDRHMRLSNVSLITSVVKRYIIVNSMETPTMNRTPIGSAKR